MALYSWSVVARELLLLAQTLAMRILLLRVRLCSRRASLSVQTLAVRMSLLRARLCSKRARKLIRVVAAAPAGVFVCQRVADTSVMAILIAQLWALKLAWTVGSFASSVASMVAAAPSGEAAAGVPMS
jgi:hypothetical protein